MSFSDIFLIGAIQAFFLAFVFLFKEKARLADKLLIVWLLFLGIHLVFVYFGFSGFYKEHPYWVICGSSLMLLEGPFLYFYTALATNKIDRFKISYLVHTVPFLFFTTYFAYKILNRPGSNLYEHVVTVFNNQEDVIVQIFGLLNHLHLITYLIFSMLILKSFRLKLPDAFSFTEDINLRWLKILVFGMAVIAIIIVVGLLVSDILPLVSYQIKASVIYSAFAVLPFYMSFYAIRQKIIYPDQIEEFANLKYEGSGLTKTDSKGLASNVLEYLVSNKPYLNPKLTIKDLADGLNLHPKQLSQVINENFNQNFFNFINSYRIAEFKDRLSDGKNDNYTLIAIAYDCGFNTKSSFNSIFKKATGKTPSDYRSSLNNS